MGSSGLDRDAFEVVAERNGLLHRCLVQVIPVQVGSLEMSVSPRSAGMLR